MDNFKTKARSARNRVAEAASTGRGSGSLSVPHQNLPAHDNASTTAVNEGFIGPQPGTAARDFAEPAPQHQQQQPVPPTSLQSSVDAGKPVPSPAADKRGAGSSRIPQNASSLQVPSPARRRSASLGNSPSQQSRAQRPNLALRQSSIGIRRMPSSERLRQSASYNDIASTAGLPRTPGPLACVHEEGTQNAFDPSTEPTASTEETAAPKEQQGGRLRKASVALLPKLFKSKTNEDKDNGPTAAEVAAAQQESDYTSNMVDVLDTVDPEVQTLTSLTNVQNSLFIPNLGRFVNRRPTYNLRRAPSESKSLHEINTILEAAREQPQPQATPRLERTQTAQSTATMATLNTIDSHMSDTRFAVLPHGTSLEGWSKEDKAELNDHVRHMLHSRRSRFKRSMRGFGHYVRRPLGFLVTLYATLITLFGLAWVLFLIGWINVGGRQLYIINIIDNVLVALFGIVGDGLAPFRAVDTYHMIYIAHYHHYTWSRRKKDMLPELHDHNDLPAGNAPISNPRDDPDPEKQWEFTVLTPKQQAKLEHHQKKFCNSHSFYKPHETETHHAFPLRLLVAIVVLLDCHSLFQIALGTCTWSIYYKRRPFALTTVILCCSITVNATAGLLIWIGDIRTRKKDVLERMNRQELTEEAIHKVEKRKEKESESEREDNDEAPKGRRSLNLNRHHNSSGSGHHISSSHKKKEESAYP